jgi:hypothetical protein
LPGLGLAAAPPHHKASGPRSGSHPIPWAALQVSNAPKALTPELGNTIPGGSTADKYLDSEVAWHRLQWMLTYDAGLVKAMQSMDDASEGVLKKYQRVGAWAITARCRRRGCVC